MLAEVGMTAKRALWCVAPSLVLTMHTYLIWLYSVTCLSLKAKVVKRYTGLGTLVKIVEQPAVDDVSRMKPRSLEAALIVLKECSGLMPDTLSRIVLYMSGNKSTI